jgi:threonine/homoserine/homoserine lactone efflux protein
MLSPLAFAVASLALLSAPGPTNTLLASAGATLGWRAWRLIFVEAAGYTIAICAMVLLLGPALATMPDFVIALKLAVAAWLMWTSVSMWRKGSKALRIEENKELWLSTNRRDRLVRKRIVFVSTLLNPKCLVFAFGLMPSADTGVRNVLSYMAGLALIIMFAGSVWISVGSLIGRAGGTPYVARTASVILACFSVALIGSTFA